MPSAAFIPRSALRDLPDLPFTASRSAAADAAPGPSFRAGPAQGPVSLASVPAVFRCGELPSGIAPGIPTGFPALDAGIPGGGWPAGALTEVLCDACGIGEMSLLLPALRYLTRAADWRGRGLLLIDPPHLPYAPALAAAGIDLDALAILRPKSEDDALWAAEQALRSGAAGAVLIWARTARGSDSAQRYQRLRRLQLAAAAGGGLGVVFSSSTASGLSTPAALRLALATAADGTLAVSLAKRRGLARPVTLTIAPRRLPRPYVAGLAGLAGQRPGDAAAPDAGSAAGRASSGLARTMSAMRAAAVRLTRERDFIRAR